MPSVDVVTKIGDDGVRSLSAGFKAIPRLTTLALTGTLPVVMGR